MAEPSLLKCNSLAIAEILGEGVLLAALCLLAKENEEIEEDDDSLWNLLSATRPLGAAKEPADDIAANVDAIYSLQQLQQIPKEKQIITLHLANI